VFRKLKSSTLKKADCNGGVVALTQKSKDWLLSLQLQRQRCSWLERFFKVEYFIFVFKTRKATRGNLNFYNAGAVTNDR
jgi:hypothetical protein